MLVPRAKTKPKGTRSNSPKRAIIVFLPEVCMGLMMRDASLCFKRAVARAHVLLPQAFKLRRRVSYRFECPGGDYTAAFEQIDHVEHGQEMEPVNAGYYCFTGEVIEDIFANLQFVVKVNAAGR